MHCLFKTHYEHGQCLASTCLTTQVCTCSVLWSSNNSRLHISTASSVWNQVMALGKTDIHKATHNRTTKTHTRHIFTDTHTHTNKVAPWHTCSVALQLPLPTSQRRAVLSKLPVASVRPSGLNATLLIKEECPCGGRVVMRMRVHGM